MGLTAAKSPTPPSSPPGDSARLLPHGGLAFVPLPSRQSPPPPQDFFLLSCGPPPARPRPAPARSNSPSTLSSLHPERTRRRKVPAPQGTSYTHSFQPSFSSSSPMPTTGGALRPLPVVPYAHYRWSPIRTTSSPVCVLPTQSEERRIRIGLHEDPCPVARSHTLINSFGRAPAKDLARPRPAWQEISRHRAADQAIQADDPIAVS